MTTETRAHRPIERIALDFEDAGPRREGDAVEGFRLRDQRNDTL